MSGDSSLYVFRMGKYANCLNSGMRIIEAMKDAVFWDMTTPFRSCKNRQCGGTYPRKQHPTLLPSCKYYIIVLYMRLNMTFDEATACQLYLHGNK
jgi:hypothetical protein